MRTDELAAMVEYAGSVGPANWIAQLRRRRTEAWAAELVRRARTEKREGTPLAALAHWNGIDGEPLDDEVLAVELLNILRPIVAVAQFIGFCTVGLHPLPAWQVVFRRGGFAALGRLL